MKDRDFHKEWTEAWPKIEFMPIDAFQVDYSYQRSLVQKRVSAIAKNFNPKLFGFVFAARREGFEKLFVVDGQTRWMAARQVGLSRVPVVVVDTIGAEDEALAFLQANDAQTKKAVSPAAEWKAALTAQEPSHLEVDRLLEKNGWVAGKNAKCYRGLLTAYREAGSKHLDIALSICRDAVIDRDLPNWLLRGLTTLLVHRHVELNHLRATVVKNYAKLDSSRAWARDSGGKPTTVTANFIVQYYNATAKRRRVKAVSPLA